MADTGVFCTTAEVQYRAGANASATANVETYINSYVAQAEAEINSRCLCDFTTNYASLSAVYKKLLSKAASCLAAIDVINFDMSGLLLSEAQTRLDVLKDTADRAINILKDQDVQHLLGVN